MISRRAGKIVTGVDDIVARVVHFSNSKTTFTILYCLSKWYSFCITST